jgi:PAS domain S-box-containing protein
MSTTGSRPASKGRKPLLPGIVALVLMAIVGLSYRQFRQYSRANADGAQSRTIVDSIDHFLETITEAETGQRGFLLTGEDRYLDPYNRAIQEIPAELSATSRLLAARSGQSSDVARLNALTADKLLELRETIELRRTRGLALAMSIVLSNRGQQSMEQIRAICDQIRRTALSSESQASAEGEAAAGTALLATIAGSVVLLFLFAFGLEPFASPEPQASRRSWLLRYGAAILAVVTIALLRGALTPLIGRTNLPFTMFFYAVAFAAWFGGFRPAVLSIVLSLLIGSWFFAVPTGSLLVSGRDDQVAMLMIVVVGFGVALLSRSQRGAVEQAGRERQRFETTLASIGDAVIATDQRGNITFANRTALSLLRTRASEVSGKPLDDVFRIINELTRATVESPVAKVLREGAIVGLANHTVLIAADGTEVPIDDSAAPIRIGDGPLEGVVLVFRDITERRHAETTNRLLASIVESSEDAIISKDLNGIITSWNRGAERMLGYSAKEIIGQPISILAAPDRPDESLEILEKIKQGEHVDHYQTVRRAKDGKLKRVSLTVSPVRDSSGRISGASKIMRDITAETEAQREIAEHRERLRVTLSSIGDAVMATDPVGRVSYLNPVAEQLTGWSSEEAAGRALEEVFRIVNEESRCTVENPVTKVLRDGQVVGLANHSVLISRDGKEIAIDDSTAPIQGDNGQIMGVVLIFRNISEKRAVEKRLAEQAAELRQKVHLMEGVACFVTDLQNRIVYWNPGAADLYGFPAEEALGRVGYSFLKTELPLPLNELLAQVKTAGAWDGELSQTRRDGSRLTVASRWALHRDMDGRPIAILEVDADITQRKAAEEALRVSNAALLRANEDLNQFAFAASHDLQEPLRMITSYSQLLLKGYRGQLDGEAAICIEFITEGNKRMRDLLASLLAYIQVAGNGQEATEPVDLNHAFQTAVKNCQAAIEESSALINSDNLPTIRGYEPHFVQLFQNLIGNGIKYRSERPPRIHVSAERQAGFWRFAVQDNGVGIAPEYHKQIFGVFKRLHGKTVPGTGIGLAICKRVVDRYGGRIWVESQLDQGATFYFTIPAEENGRSGA